MLTRRSSLMVLGASFLTEVVHGQTAHSEYKGFDELFSSVYADIPLLEATRSQREGAKDFFDFHVSRAIAPRPAPSSRKVSERAVGLITTFEVTSAQRYDRAYRRPIWPHGDSGITIGIGYDLGYVKESWLTTDWGEIISPRLIDTLRGACGLKGSSAQAKVHDFSDVDISWELAQRQFRERLLPLYVAETLNRLPNASRLSDDSLGAMVSLVYNRGGNFTSHHPRRAEMFQIRQLMIDKQYDHVPEQIRSMKRIWQGDPSMKGLIERRELEARLFEAGLRVG